MIESNKVNNYCKYYYNNLLLTTRVGYILGIIAFVLFMYSDRYIYVFPYTISIFRIVLIIYYIFALFFSYLFKYKSKILKVIITISNMATLIFASVVTIYVSTNMPDYFYEFSQIFILITIGMIVFAGISIPYLNYLLTTNLLFYILAIIIFNGFSIGVFFENINIILFSICSIVFSYIFIRDRVFEYENLILKKKMISDLENEIIIRKKLEFQLKEIATYDVLTKAYTRGIGLEMLEEELAKVSLDYIVSIIYIDMNNLKIINDTYGHEIGDMYMVGLVDIINENLNKNDFCVRIGGDEFLIVLPSTKYNAADKVWKSINKACNDFYIKDYEIKIPLSVSHGLLDSTTINYSSVEEFIAEADKKMYEEKRGFKS